MRMNFCFAFFAEVFVQWNAGCCGGFFGGVAGVAPAEGVGYNERKVKTLRSL